MFELTDKVAIVTGATKGIGKQIALMLAQNGAKVAILGRNKERGAEVENSICHTGGIAEFFYGDIALESECHDLIQRIVEKFNGVDILVNCAGMLTSTPIEHISREEWDSVLATNLSGTFFMIQKALPYLKESRRGRIINISSNAGRMGGYENSQAYTASKGGIIAITMGIARQLAKDKITVNVVCPGTTATEMVDLYSEDKINRLKQRIPLGRLGKPEEVAATVCFLASEEAAYITGAVIDVNGGMYMG